MLSQELLKEALGKALSTGADYAEIFAEHTQSKKSALCLRRWTRLLMR